MISDKANQIKEKKQAADFCNQQNTLICLSQSFNIFYHQQANNFSREELKNLKFYL
ncbi:hypothetical protein [Sedimentisphaera salicampi]|uniref:hypothetical protein n=1 Tax=Sedimentisphaera salicampi TaxID=1941349 RepID=UPI00137480F9|nr:hypothetical protein [Sedimentisphaera salicampi]